MKRSNGLSVLLITAMLFGAFGATQFALAQDVAGGRLVRDLIGGAALIFRRPANPDSGAGGGRISGGRAKTPTQMQNQIIAKGNAARSAPTPRFSEAETQYKLATNHDPDDARAFFGLGNVYLDQARFAEAVDAYKKALKVKPDYQPVYLPLGFSLIKLNNFTEAIDVYNQLAKLDPDNPEIYNNLGYAYNHSERYTEAIDVCLKAIGLLDTSGQAFRLGYLSRDEVLSQAHKNLGYAYNGLNRYNEAADALRQAAMIEPTNASAQFNLGLALYNGGRYSESIEAYKQVLKLRPTLPQAHYNLGLVYVAINDKNAALGEYNTLKSLNSDLADQLYTVIR